MAKTTLLIARHGNTFTPEQTPTRVGARTDLSLVPSGQEQARYLGRYLEQHNLVPNVIFTSHLKRTYEMAEIACAEMERTIPAERTEIFNEIDYGPDENKTEDEVIARLGEQPLKDWDEKGLVPDGWLVDPHGIIQSWKDFAEKIEQDYAGQIVLVITSNGIARFAPHLTGDFEAFSNSQQIKISTGALCVFEKNDSDTFWTITEWNTKPKKVLEESSAA
jgi:2,3-bisphosphoglycerate-dependent phosphoglycerate mutase